MVRVYLGKWQEHMLSSFSLSNLKTHKALTLGGYKEPGGGMMVSKGWWRLVFIGEKKLRVPPTPLKSRVHPVL
jgi:hypothetical protein